MVYRSVVLDIYIFDSFCWWFNNMHLLVFWTQTLKLVNTGRYLPEILYKLFLHALLYFDSGRRELQTDWLAQDHAILTESISQRNSLHRECSLISTLLLLVNNLLLPSRLHWFIFIVHLNKLTYVFIEHFQCVHSFWAQKFGIKVEKVRWVLLFICICIFLQDIVIYSIYMYLV